MRTKETDVSYSNWQYENWECDICNKDLSKMYTCDGVEMCEKCLIEDLVKANIIQRDEDPFLFYYNGEIYEWYALEDRLVKDDIIKIDSIN